MSLPPHPGVFTTVERQWAGRYPVPELRLFTGSEGAGVPIALEQAREMLYDRCVEPAVRTALWHQIAERLRMDADRSDWPSAVVWLGLPGLRRTGLRITWYFHAEREDVEAELVTCYLEALTEVGAHTPDPGDRVFRSACSRAWTVFRRARPETAVDDVEGVGGIPLDTDTDDPWQVDYDPPAGRTALSASRRITVPAHRVEGVRIGALAQAWGLVGTAAGTAHSGRGRQVATISLRRSGRKG
ncbi:hypothetical protein [Streptomyces sp. CoH17]|uniref:hypothetical protein n=1 Tax=Streptomyces sp. CoH17 TaxID=2992806 RepID=UPI002270E6B3|nr:hypothetical protein [Streptomyces sp. CoH17]